MAFPKFSIRSLIFCAASAGWFSWGPPAGAQSVPASLPNGVPAAPSPSALSPVGVLRLPAATEAAILESARGALVGIEEAHSKALAAQIPSPPAEELWNDVPLPHILQEPWFDRTDSPADPLHSPVTPATWLLRDMASIHSAPSTHLSPLSIRPPFQYFPVPITDGTNADEVSFDSPHFRVILPKSENDRVPIPSQKIIEKLEDSLVLMQMMPIYFAKAHPRNVPLKITIRLEYDDSTKKNASGITSTIKVVGDVITVKINSKFPQYYLEACVCGLANYLLHPMLVHPVIKTGFQEILLRSTPQVQGKEVEVRTTAADRKAARLAEREAKKLEDQLRKLKIPGLVAPIQRTYSFNDTITVLRRFAAAKSWDVDAEVAKTLKSITPHEECGQSTCETEMTETKARLASAVITAFFLFGDNDGDPIHLQNYFTSLQLLGSNQQAHARLYCGRDIASIRSEIRSWATP